MWDVSDLEKPELRRVYYSQETAIDHNLYIKGKLVLHFLINKCQLNKVFYFTPM